MPTKKYLRKKAKKLCLMGDRKPHLSGILTEPLNPRVVLNYNIVIYRILNFSKSFNR